MSDIHIDASAAAHSTPSLIWQSVGAAAWIALLAYFFGFLDDAIDRTHKELVRRGVDVPALQSKVATRLDEFFDRTADHLRHYVLGKERGDAEPMEGERTTKKSVRFQEIQAENSNSGDALPEVQQQQQQDTTPTDTEEKSNVNETDVRANTPETTTEIVGKQGGNADSVFRGAVDGAMDVEETGTGAVPREESGKTDVNTPETGAASFVNDVPREEIGKAVMDASEFRSAIADVPREETGKSDLEIPEAAAVNSAAGASTVDVEKVTTGVAASSETEKSALKEPENEVRRLSLPGMATKLGATGSSARRKSYSEWVPEEGRMPLKAFGL